MWWLLAGAAWSADLVHGYAKATAQATLSDAVPGAGARLQLDLGQRREALSWRGALDIDADAQGDAWITPVEIKVVVHQPAFDLALGKQAVFWGVTDWVNPTDLFTPWDYTGMSSEIEDYRPAPWAARWTGWWGGSSLDLVWVPFPMPDHIDWSVADTGTLAIDDTVLPERTLANSSVGGRLAGHLGGFDLSAMAFHGMDKRPGMDMRVDLSTMPPDIALIPTHHMMTALGGDLARGVGPVLIKSEVATYLTEDRDGTDPTVRNPEVFAVGGLTWVPTSSLSLSVQGTWNHLLRYDPDDEAQNWQDWASAQLDPDMLAAAQAMGMGFDFPEAGPTDAYGLVERLGYAWKDTLRLSVVGVQSVDDHDHFEMAMASWSAMDGLSVLAGVLLFGGPEGTRFGASSDASKGWAEVKASF